jgi:3-methyladenine DNA glycosylase/8-oxoguanine DNA glycosylase
VRELRATYLAPSGFDLAGTLRPLQRGPRDPAMQVIDGTIWRTTNTRRGPATIRLRVGAPSAPVGAGATETSPRRTDRVTPIDARIWGGGHDPDAAAEAALEALPALLGACDEPAGFRPRHPVLAELARRHAGVRLPRTAAVFEALVPAVLEQKVTGAEARRSWCELLQRFGSPAPGPAPAGMRVPPSAEVWRRVPSWEWHRAGVEDKRARPIALAAVQAGALERLTDEPPEQARARLQSLAGVGPWTAAEVAQRAFGDPDAVSVGDYNLPSLVGWSLAGRVVDDEEMLELLEPYAPQRYRAVRLLELGGRMPPRRGPRLPARSHARW